MRALRAFGLVATLVLALPVVACSADITDGSDTSEDDLISTDPIGPAELLQCWVVPSTEADPFFQSHEVKCAATRPDKYPLVPARYIVEAATARNDVISGMFTEGEKSLGRIRNDDFPLVVRSRIMFARTGEIGDGFTLKHEARIERLTSATPTQKLGVKVPFTLWPLEIQSPQGQRLIVTARYTVPTPGFRVGSNFNIPETDPEELALSPFVELGGGSKELFMIAPAQGGIDVNVHGKAAKIPGPGTYAWNGEALTKVTNDRPGVPPAAGSTAAPAPTCGTQGQAPCQGGACAPSHRLDAGKCVACGGDKQTYCTNAQGNRACADGHRLDQNDWTCKACGSAGQTYCTNAQGNRSCTEGHRLDQNDWICKPCGGQGETYCVNTLGNRTCDAGHRLDSNDWTCKACGKDGQTYCVNASGNRFCADSHRLDSNDWTCKVCGGEGQTYCTDASGNRVCNPGLRLNTSTNTCVR